MHMKRLWHGFKNAEEESDSEGEEGSYLKSEITFSAVKCPISHVLVSS